MSSQTSGDERRRKVIAQRKALPTDRATRLSQEISDRWLASLQPSLLKDRRIALYRALPGELSLIDLEARLSQLGARLCFPRMVDHQESRLEMVEVPAELLQETQWIQGFYGVSEPPAHLKEVPPESLDLIFVPGVAFGLQGERIGMGAGFYDRYLVRASKALRLALVFDFQLFPQLEQKPWDQRVHWILSEKREFRTEAAQKF